MTAKPGEMSEQHAEESAPTAVYVSEAIDLSKTEDELGRLLPNEIVPVARRLPRVVCQTVAAANGQKVGQSATAAAAAGKQVCQDAKVWGHIYRDGSVKIAGSAQGLELTVPLAYDLTVQSVGPGAATVIHGKTSVVAAYTMTLDERWQPALKLGSAWNWPQGARIKVLDGELNTQSEVEAILNQRLGKVPSAALAGLVPSDLRQQADLAWRNQHYPIALSQEQQIWLRGTPVGLHFAGIALTANGPEVRLAITARLQTFVGDRPAPLPPAPLAQLGSGLEPSGGGIVLPGDVSYKTIALAAAQHLPAIPPAPAAKVGETTATSVKSVAFYSSGPRVAVAVHLGLPAGGTVLASQGVAYFVATPAMKPGSSDVVLKDCVSYGAASKKSTRRKDMPLLDDTRFAENIASAVAVGVGDQLTAALETVRAQQSLVLAKGFRLWLSPKEAKVIKINPASDGLHLQIEVVSELAVRREGTDVASGGGDSRATP